MIARRVILFLTLVFSSSALATFDIETGRITDETWKSGVPLGGIGCGKIEILTDGSFGYYTGNHNWDRPTGVIKGAFASVYAESGSTKGARILRLKTNSEYSDVENVAGVEYVGWFPTAEVKYNDAALPVKVEMLGWSPLIPHNGDDSSLPVAVMRFKVTNPGKESARAVIAMAWPNLIGWGGHRGVEWNDLKGNSQGNTGSHQVSGLVYFRDGNTQISNVNVDGTYLLAAVNDGCEVTTLPMFDAGEEKIAWWQSFKSDGSLGKSSAIETKQPAGAVAAEVKLAAGEAKTIEFMLVWHFPHHLTAPDSSTGKFVRGARGGEEAFDGQSQTRWTTGQSMKPGQTFAIEMGQEREIARVVLENKPDKDDYPRGARIDVSEDAKHWTVAAEVSKEQIARAKNEGVLDVSFPPVKAKHVKIVQQGSAEGKWWSIHEMNMYDAGGAAIPRGDWAGWPYHEKVVPDMVHAVDVGHRYSTRFINEIEIANYVVANQDRLLNETLAWQEPVKNSNLPAWLKTKLINSVFPLYACGILTKDGRFSVLESPVDMHGSLGTMDQRMAAHAFYTQMFPELDQSELRLFAECQDKVVIHVGKGASATTKPADGRISHFCGNVHETIGDPNVNYGVTNWPDLSCSFIMQTEKLYKWTGDKQFADEMYPHVKRALAWLETAAPPGEMIPQGGSTYDYEHIPDAAFIYNASCYLGALRAGAEMAREEGDSGMQSAYLQRFAVVQASVMKELWNGEFFIKLVDPKTGKKNPNSFVAALAGDWLSRLSACGRTLDPKISHAETKELLARHMKAFYPVMPMEVTPDGKQATQACYVIQHEPYLGCEAIYEGFTDDGLEVIRRVYELAWTQNRNPWHESLMYRSPGGLQQGLVSYMTCPATWHVLNALSGATIDIPAQTLYFSPRTGDTMNELHMPVNFSRAWLWMDYVPAQHSLKIKVTRTFGDPVTIRAVAGEAGGKSAKLETPFVMKEGETLDLSGELGVLVPKDR
jgi:uncharacterized protein (DUF608 family)